MLRKNLLRTLFGLQNMRLNIQAADYTVFVYSKVINRIMNLEKCPKCLTNCHLIVSPMQISTLNKIAQPFFHLQKVWIIIRIKSIMAILAICVNFHFGTVNFNSQFFEGFFRHYHWFNWHSVQCKIRVRSVAFDAEI